MASSDSHKPLFSSLAGFALEMGDRLLINGEAVIFKGWVDQSLTAIEVKAIANEQAPIKQIRARDIRSLARSLDDAPTSEANTANTVNTGNTTDTKTTEASEESTQSSFQESQVAPSAHSSARSDIAQELENSDQEQVITAAGEEPETASEEQSEITKEPEYNAWEVWMYLERQRLKTLKLLNTFQAEWEANRFVREAERSAPPTLRVHYEIRPVWLDESTLHSSEQSSERSSDQHSQSPEQESEHDPAAIYADVIDVEIIS